VGWKQGEADGFLREIGLSENQCGMETSGDSFHTPSYGMLSENQCGMETVGPVISEI